MLLPSPKDAFSCASAEGRLQLALLISTVQEYAIPNIRMQPSSLFAGRSHPSATLLRALLRLKVSFFFGDAWLKETFCFF